MYVQIEPNEDVKKRLREVLELLDDPVTEVGTR